jgi:hypothetical protein
MLKDNSARVNALFRHKKAASVSEGHFVFVLIYFYFAKAPGCRIFSRIQSVFHPWLKMFPLCFAEKTITFPPCAG